jgi:hypothetical protein
MPMSREQRDKANCRSYTATYQRLGRWPLGSCQVCGDQAENHHPDYQFPGVYFRLCRLHHMSVEQDALCLLVEPFKPRVRKIWEKSETPFTLRRITSGKVLKSYCSADRCLGTRRCRDCRLIYERAARRKANSEMSTAR